MYDLTVLGGGPGGYVAAIRAAQLGLSVCIIEEKEVGGTCLNRGCIPTKAILASADLYRNMQKAKEFGLSAGEISFDFQKILERKNNIVQNLRNGVLKLLKDRKINIIKGRGRLLNKNEIDVSRETIKSSKIILATGSEPLIPEMFNINSKRVITSNEALEMEELPRSIIIAGGGYLGCEWACIYRAFGCDVTVVEMLKTIVPTEDVQVSRFLQTFMQKQNIKFMTGSKILEIKETDNQIEATLEGGKSVKADYILLSLGRKLNTSGMGFEETGIKIERGRVEVDEYLNTNIPGIYAIGDITGKKLLAHVASAQGIIAAENATNKNRKMINYDTIPGCIYTFPEVASVGLTEESAKEKGIKYVKSRFPFAANGKASAMGETEGFVKVLAGEEDHKILGVHIIGPKATELIGECANIITQGLTAKEVLKAVHPHPTVSESLQEAFAGIEKECIHFMGM
ncbi:MAG TPA: dihydrolipoyl dehydrogenase [Candidatus Eremiobacteraeota bacterium]|nr:MAG: Dihydrolipoyl dehydrogenase [bacterium ADurb.Bin363]HPZ09872.1 dihydrolipoyl dehydrogenase [Candidatus Eremiobacteraeota bacterium]